MVSVSGQWGTSVILFGFTSASAYKPIEVIEGYRDNRNKYNNQDRVKAGNPNPYQLIQDKNTKCYYSNRQTEGKGNPFYDINLFAMEKYQCPGEAG